MSYHFVLTRVRSCNFFFKSGLIATFCNLGLKYSVETFFIHCKCKVNKFRKDMDIKVIDRAVKLSLQV